jgi:hypothetical protein
MSKLNINIECDVLDCTDKIIIYKMKQYPEDQIADAARQHTKNIRIINEICKPKALIRIMEPGFIKSMDKDKAIDYINGYIDELYRLKEELLEDEEDEDGK